MTSIDLTALEADLDKYSFNIRCLSDHEIKSIKNLYTMLKTCLNNKIFIENLNGHNIRINNIITVSGDTLPNKVTNKSTIHFINCQNLTVQLGVKVGHLTIERCENLNIKIVGGSITGYDCISCRNITHVFDKGNINYIDISSSLNCNYYLSEQIAISTIIQTMNSMHLKFVTLDDHRITNTFDRNKSFFDILKTYKFIINNDQIEIVDISKTSQFNLNIQPVFRNK